MCSIFTLMPGQNIDEDKLENVVGNNMDGYGIILVENKKLEIRRGFDEKGTDPEEINRILVDNNDVIRHVHVRNTTKGLTNSDNCHPFPCFSGERDVYMMHNGTFDFKYHPKVGDDRNDSRIFNDDFLIPFLSRFKGEFGFADYNDPIFKDIIDKYVGTGNRLLLVSNDLQPLRVGTWNQITNTDGSQFLASNDYYFKSLIRGPRKVPLVPVVSHYGAHWQSQIRQNTGGTGNVVPIKEVADKDVPFSVEQEGTKEVKKTGTALTEITKLQDIETDKLAYDPPSALLKALGTEDGLFKKWGLDCIFWYKDIELANALKMANGEEVAAFFRALFETAEAAQEDVELAEQVIERYKDEQTDFIKTIEMLTREIDQLREGDEVEHSLKLDNKLLKKQNELMARQIEKLMDEKVAA